ncbi:hypothetical protein [Novosphingobium sp. SG707]|uniref:hypothetical protein n=1 Tax=Novosphingobium sp. SG707 TaxID=2586996 RepID=UPI0014454CE1|nr:hypothetical protein [Novosphingobium sp. SG707]NKI99612.1 hypothetical protein [Novosphingobium sp. SG707]
MKKFAIAVLWPTEGNYDRLCAISADYMPPTLAEYRQAVSRRMALAGLTEIDVMKVEFDPDALQSWCVAQSTPVNSAARSEFAAFLGMKLHETAEIHRTGKQTEH